MSVWMYVCIAKHVYMYVAWRWMEDEIYVERYTCIKTRGTSTKICAYYVCLQKVYRIIYVAWLCLTPCNPCRHACMRMHRLSRPL